MEKYLKKKTKSLTHFSNRIEKKSYPDKKKKKTFKSHNFFGVNHCLKHKKKKKQPFETLFINLTKYIVVNRDYNSIRKLLNISKSFD